MWNIKHESQLPLEAFLIYALKWDKNTLIKPLLKELYFIYIKDFADKWL